MEIKSKQTEELVIYTIAEIDTYMNLNVYNNLTRLDFARVN